jgi:hypothetical protein
MTMQLIETKTLGTAAASIEFTSIPQDGTDLVALISTRTNRANTQNDTVLLRPNGVTTNLSSRRLYGNGSSVFSFTGTVIYAGEASTTSQTSNTFGNSLCYMPNYAGSTNKSFSTDGSNENNASSNSNLINAGLWSSTAAITSLTFLPEVGTQFEVGSMISLYKITKGSGGATVS